MAVITHLILDSDSAHITPLTSVKSPNLKG